MNGWHSTPELLEERELLRRQIAPGIIAVPLLGIVGFVVMVTTGSEAAGWAAGAGVIILALLTAYRVIELKLVEARLAYRILGRARGRTR